MFLTHSTCIVHGMHALRPSHQIATSEGFPAFYLGAVARFAPGPPQPRALQHGWPHGAPQGPVGPQRGPPGVMPQGAHAPQRMMPQQVMHQ